MRRFAFACCCAAVVGGCGKSENRADTTAIAAPPPPAETPAAAPATLSYGDLAGKWNMRTTNEAGDSTLVRYVLTAKNDSSGWTITFPNRAPITVHPAVSGDSLILDAGPYPSVLRKGVQVTTHGVSRLQDGKLVGTTVAHYQTKGADSVRRLVIEGTRAPK
jgi:hypothetical protein